MGIYDSMLDPLGGREDRTSLSDVGMLGMDIGFGLFGKRIGKYFAKQGYKTQKLMAQQRYREGPLASYQRAMGTFPQTPNSKAERRAFIHAERKSYKAASKVSARGGYRSGLAFGKALSKIGWFAGAIGILDLAIGLGASMAGSGLDRDMDRILAGDELMPDTSAAYSQRQRSLQAIHDSQLSVGRSLIGQEASYLHS